MFEFTEDPTRTTAHRPWPLPSGPWIMGQRWNNLLFAHYPVSRRLLRELVPPPLTVEEHSGSGWISVTPFHLSHLRPRGIPSLPWVSEFPELNVRTYVNYGGKSGVYFFSLDAGSPLAVAAARLTYHLPYYNAAMAISNGSGGAIHYHSHRTDERAPGADFDAEYHAFGQPESAARGSLDEFLAERYCLYAVDDDAMYRAEIHHEPWPLERAEAEVKENTMAAASGIALTTGPEHLRFVRHIDVVVWAPERIV